MQSTSLPAATKAERERFSYFPQIGCIACHKLGHFTLPETHHQLSGGRRISHSATVPLCPWHHQGTVPSSCTERKMGMLFGPSMAKQSKRFREIFGSDQALLEETDRRYAIIRSQRVDR